jgi:hypothetical protein
MQSVFNAALLARLARQTEGSSLTLEHAESLEATIVADLDPLLLRSADPIQEPAKEGKRKQPSLPEPHGKLETQLPPLPWNAYPLEEGLHRALPSMPERVQAFLLHVPRDPPAWRYQESEGERAERHALENLGAWTG